MNNVGRMKRIIGTVSNAGSRAAFPPPASYAPCAFRSEDAQETGQAACRILAVCCNVLTTARIPSELVRVLSCRTPCGGRGERSVRQR